MSFATMSYSPVMENQMEKKTKNEMEAGSIITPNIGDSNGKEHAK